MSLNLEVRLWKRCASEGRRCSGAANIIASSRTNYHSSMSGASSSIPPRNRMMRSLLPFSSSSSFRGAASFVESTAIVKAMELLGRFRWILVFILLTDGAASCLRFRIAIESAETSF
ncbi:unnamed protein product [Orchesella dallaii]|uniref:Uncharacterized protein n=1 Tax=Orchesella dallaii TaxID=48710 RepID=A0ABP1RG86_9HEXA